MNNIIKKSFCWSKNLMVQRPGASQIKNVTMVPGPGIGQELCSII